MEHKVSYGEIPHKVVNRLYPQFNIASNTLFKDDFSSDYKSLSEKDKTMGDFAAISYQSERPEKFMEHTYDKDISDDMHSIYHKPDHVIFSNRGTKDFNPDLYSDIGIATGNFQFTKRSKISADKMRKVMKKYPNVPITTTSHSLGAYTQMHMLHHNKDINDRIDKQYLFNPGASSFDFRLKNFAENDKNHFFCKHGDSISLAMIAHTTPKNLKLLCRNLHYNPIKNHTIGNFTSDMNRLPVIKHGEIKYDPKASYPEIKGNPHNLLKIR